MKERKIALIACKVLAIYVLIQGIIQISNFMTVSLYPLVGEPFSGVLNYRYLLLTLLPAIVLIVLGVVLWGNSERISIYMIPDDKNEGINKEIDMEELQSVALSVAGIVIVVTVIPAFFREIPNIVQLQDKFIRTNSLVRIKIMSSLTEKLIRLILGLLLTLKGKGIAGIVRRLQNAGIKETDEE